MDTNLKALAEAAKSSTGPAAFAIWGSLELTEFRAACSPEVILTLLAERDALRMDAERYRWIREHGDAYVDGEQLHGLLATYYDGPHLQQGPELDELIDAAMEQPK